MRWYESAKCSLIKGTIKVHKTRNSSFSKKQTQVIMRQQLSHNHQYRRLCIFIFHYKTTIYAKKVWKGIMESLLSSYLVQWDWWWSMWQHNLAVSRCSRASEGLLTEKTRNSRVRSPAKTAVTKSIFSQMSTDSPITSKQMHIQNRYYDDWRLKKMN